MADIERTVSILFSGADSGLTGAIDKVSAGFDRLRAEGGILWDIFGSKTAQAALAILAVDAALTSLAGTALAYAIQQSGKFGDRFNEITTLIPKSQTALAGFRDDILQFAQTSTMSLDDINNALYEAISSGTKYEDALQLLTTTEKLAAAGGADLTSTTKFLQQAMNAYGASVSETNRYSDAFLTIVKDGVVTIPQLSQHMGEVISVAAGGGVSIEQLGAAIAATTAYGMPAAQAMTAIKAAIVAILAPAPEAEKAFQALGVAYGESALKAQGLDGVLKSIYVATGGNVAQIRDLIPSVEALPAVLSLGKDAGGKFAEALTDMANKAGATEEAFNRMKDNLKLVTDNMLNNIKVFAVDVGDELINTFKGTEKGVAELFEAADFALETGVFDGLFEVLNRLGLDFNTWLANLSKSLPEALTAVDFSKFEASIVRIADAVKKLIGDFDPSNPEEVADAIQKVVDALTSLGNLTAGTLSLLEKPIQLISAAIEVFGSISNEAWSKTGELASQIVLLGMLLSSGGTLMTGIAALGAKLLLLTDQTDYLSKVFEAFLNGASIGIDVLKLGTLGLVDIIILAAEKMTALYEFLGFDHIFGSAEEYKKNLQLIREAIEPEIEKLVSKIDADATDLSNKIGWTTGKTREQLSDEFLTIEQDWAKLLEETSNTEDIFYLGDPEETASQAREHNAAINTNLPATKTVKVNTDLEIAKLKADAEYVQKQLEWKAKLDIAEVESHAKIMAESFKSLGEMAKAAGEAAAEGFKTLGVLGQPGKDSHFYEVYKLVEAELSIQRDALETLKNLSYAQMSYYQAKTTALNNPQHESLISISASGLEPELEAFMWQIIKKVQIRANEEQASFLLGLKS